MTVIVYKDGILAADRQCTISNVKLPARKIWKGCNAIVAGTGDLSSVVLMKEWYFAGADLNNYPECQRDKEDWARLVVMTKHAVFHYERGPVAIHIDCEGYAWGGGRDVAMGALYMGASAEEAAQAACQYAEGCGIGVIAYSRNELF